MTSRVLQVEGMSCGHCVATIEKVVGGVAGVRSVAVNLEKGEVAIDFDEAKTGIDRISAKIKEAGYEVASL